MVIEFFVIVSSLCVSVEIELTNHILSENSQLICRFSRKNNFYLGQNIPERFYKIFKKYKSYSKISYVIYTRNVLCMLTASLASKSVAIPFPP